MRILEILQAKDEQANKNLGDPASFLHVFDPEKEAAKVADIMAAGTSPQEFEATIDAAQASSEHSDTGDGDDDGNWLLKLFSQVKPEAPLPTNPSPAPISSAPAFRCLAMPKSVATTPSPRPHWKSFRQTNPHRLI